MSKVVIMDHPLIKHKIGVIRRIETGTKDFRQAISEIAMLICYEATRDLELDDVEITTPICKTTVKQLKGRKLCIVPILRAGLGMVDGMLSLIPTAKVGHIGLYRDPETLQPVEYFCKMPVDVSEREIFMVDPMLATGGSSIAAIQMLKDRGCKKIHFMCIIAAPEGLRALQEAHPDVDIYIGALDEKLNSDKYIVPGLGDAVGKAGQRLEIIALALYEEFLLDGGISALGVVVGSSEQFIRLLVIFFVHLNLLQLAPIIGYDLLCNIQAAVPYLGGFLVHFQA